MDKFSNDWFEIVEEQSDGSVAMLALNDLSYYITVTDPNGFMVVNMNKLPAELKPFLDDDTVAPIIPFSHPNKVLLQNDKLSKYLELAKAFKVYTQDSDYVEVLFDRRGKNKSFLTHQPLDLDNLDKILENAPFYSIWEMLIVKEDHEIVAQLLLEAERKMTRPFEDTSGESLDGNIPVTLMMTGGLLASFERSAFLAVANAWLQKFQKARDHIACTGIAAMRYTGMAPIVRYYLEILMIYEQEGFLAEFFSNEMLLKAYLTHYEIYMQKFVDPGFVCTRVQQGSVVRRRMEDFREMYYRDGLGL
ncbi:MAG: hypothetical protein ABIP95_16925 [Pelobium sp.]